MKKNILGWKIDKKTKRYTPKQALGAYLFLLFIYSILIQVQILKLLEMMNHLEAYIA